MNCEEFLIRLKFSNNVKMIVLASPEDKITTLIHKIKQSYGFYHSRIIEIGRISDEKGYEIVEDIRLGSLLKSGDVLLVDVREVKALTNNVSYGNNLLNYDFNGRHAVQFNEESTTKPMAQAHTKEPKKEAVKPKTVPVEPKKENVDVTKEAAKSPNEKEGGETSALEAETKPKRKRTTKPKESQTKSEASGEENKPKQVEQKTKVDPFGIFKDVKEAEEEPKNSANLLPPATEEDKKNIKGLKKKAKVDYNAL